MEFDFFFFSSRGCRSFKKNESGRVSLTCRKLKFVEIFLVEKNDR